MFSDIDVWLIRGSEKSRAVDEGVSYLWLKIQSRVFQLTVALQEEEHRKMRMQRKAHTPFWPTSSIISYAVKGLLLLCLAMREKKIIS